MPPTTIILQKMEGDSECQYKVWVSDGLIEKSWGGFKSRLDLAIELVSSIQKRFPSIKTVVPIGFAQIPLVWL